jgi:hypothetical protein
MAQEGRNRLAEWLLLIREQVPVVRQRFEDWLSAVREEPVLLWETIAVRYAFYGVGGLLLVWAVSGVTGLLTPPPPARARPAATAADFHVVCRDTVCAKHFVIHREFGFRNFPVVCPACEQQTGARARRCNSQTCRGRWVAPEEIQGAQYCPVCGTRFD